MKAKVPDRVDVERSVATEASSGLLDGCIILFFTATPPALFTFSIDAPVSSVPCDWLYYPVKNVRPFMAAFDIPLPHLQKPLHDLPEHWV